jgi:hypothetical protein
MLMHCVDQGLTIEETVHRVKTAADTLQKTAILDDIISGLKMLTGKGMDMGQSMATSALSYGIPAALLAPPALGAVGGYGLAKLTGGSDESPDDLKTQEKVDAYRLAMQATRANTADAEKQRAAKGQHRSAYRDLV